MAEDRAKEKENLKAPFVSPTQGRGRPHRGWELDSQYVRMHAPLNSRSEFLIIKILFCRSDGIN
jgi:hypothetical protein